MDAKRKSSSAALYVGTLGVLVVGLWATLAAGSRLRAPHDLSGVWRARLEGARGGGRGAETLTVGQSGRFVRLTRRDGTTYDLRWTGEQVDAVTGETVVRLEGKRHTLTVRTPAPASGEAAAYRFELTGETNRAWAARRQNAEAAGPAPAAAPAPDRTSR